MSEYRLMTVTVVVRYLPRTENEPSDWRWDELLETPAFVLNAWPTEVEEMVEADSAGWKPAREEMDRILEEAAIDADERAAEPDDGGRCLCHDAQVCPDESMFVEAADPSEIE